MAKDPELLAHLEWLGYVQPVGLVVSPPALLAAQAHINRNIIGEHRRFLEYVEQADGDAASLVCVHDLPGVLFDLLAWERSDVLGLPGGEPVPDSLEVALPEYDDRLKPSYAVREFQPAEGKSPWLMLIHELPLGTDLDERPRGDDIPGWQASPQARFERLLRETQVPIGLLFNGTQFRLVYAPRGESSGYATFDVKAMSEVGGRPIFAAFQLLLSFERLYSVSEKQRLPAILAESRKYQNQVSAELAKQVLAALYELLRGFQAANERSNGRLLKDVLKEDPDQVYAGLLTVLLRLVFILYAEDRNLVSDSPVYANHYSVTGLFQRLRADAGRYPDTMDLRYGAWAQLLSLFRLIYDGAAHGNLRLPARQGHLFDPDRYPFLEGRPWGIARVLDETIDPPMVPDGVVYRVLDSLLILDGERLSYRSLDVEQIGSVYETMMGFSLEVASGRSIAIKPAKAHGAPATINLEDLLGETPANRAKWLREKTGQDISGKAADSLKKAGSVEELVAALEPKVAKEASPGILPPGALVLQPTDARRRSGSHYTPRSLTEPIVRTTLKPILDRLGPRPTPDEILDLKVCDPAMGSGAFLVEASRQLGDQLVKAWHEHRAVPRIPPDEDEVLHARRLIVQKCLYGVDKNQLAVDLARLSLWLATLAKDHAFTFLDHSFRCGDSLVGLTRNQIAAFNWQESAQLEFLRPFIKKRLEECSTARAAIRDAGEEATEQELRWLLKEADEALTDVRMVGDLAVASFFEATTARDRESKRAHTASHVQGWLTSGNGWEALSLLREQLSEGQFPVRPFHWETEFPEVFDREGLGFDAIVGNPPFAGKNTLINGNREGYVDWLKAIHEESHGNSDLVAHFFRRAFNLLRTHGCFGLIATNTIGQGDTRSTGLRWICTHGGTIYAARKRYKWPGQAAVVVSVAHIAKACLSGPFNLDDRSVPLISAYLFHAGGHEDPAVLRANAGKSFQGCIVLGMGFTFDDTDIRGVANTISEMHRLIAKDRRNAERIIPYIGGEEVNDSPTHAHHRYVINFGEMTEEEARKWPMLMAIVEQKVKPERLAQKDRGAKEKWWQFIRPRPEMQSAIAHLDRVLTIARVSQTAAFTFLPAGQVFSEQLVVFALDSFANLATLQSLIHESWARLHSSSMKDDLRYNPSDCFETFPFPDRGKPNAELERAGCEYHQFRATWMSARGEGLTDTYRRFHDPEETLPDIVRLRELHAAMDRAVLNAYGWTDIPTSCEFFLDYEDDDEEESEGGRRRKKPWRYRWPDEVRDEVLARLLALNHQRAEEERLAGLAASSKSEATGAKTRKRSRKAAEMPLLTGLEEGR